MILSVIIVSYNTQTLLIQCLNSVYTAIASFPKAAQVEVIVIDNASTDGSAQKVAQTFPQVRLILNTENTGFARANNEGIKIARGQYLLLLNSDTQILGNALTVLTDFLNHTPKAAAVTPKVILTDGTIDLACHRGLPNPWNALTYFTGLEKIFPRIPFFAGYHQTYKNLAQIHPVAATAATALLIRRKALDQIGLFDERFFLYGEDLDLCKRLTDASWQIFYHPHAIVLHHKSASGKNQKNAKQKTASVDHFYTTMKQFFEKHYHDRYPAWFRQLVYWGIDLKQKLHR